MFQILKINKLNIDEIAKALLDISKKAREKIAQNDIEGSTFTISSLGIGTGFTPIINPEVGIIGVSRTKILGIHNKELIENYASIDTVYDHRVINGVDVAISHFIKLQLKKVYN